MTPPDSAEPSSRGLVDEHWIESHDDDCPRDYGVLPPRCNEPCSCDDEPRRRSLAIAIDALVAARTDALEKRNGELESRALPVGVKHKFYLDHRLQETDSVSLTGFVIRAYEPTSRQKLALFIEGIDGEPDKEIDDSEIVSLVGRREAPRFFFVPSATT